MSADLFAEFGFATKSAQPSNTTRQQSTRSQTNSLIPDLETLEDAVPTTDFSTHLSQSTSRTTQLQTPSNQYTYSNKSKTPQLQHYGNDVLFDATLENISNDESEDWGEFESAEITTGPGQSTGLVQQPKSRTIEHSKNSTGLPIHTNLIDSLSVEDNPSPAFGQPTSAQAKIQRSQKKDISSHLPVEEDPFEEWGDFTDGPPTESSRISGREDPSLHKKKPAQAAVVPGRGSSITFSTSSDSTPQVRPTNIPPPSILLELFPQLLEQLREEASKVKKDLKQKEAVENAACLILCTLKSVARVVAGRTLRWKRDEILSQSMRIGPARSGKSGGMKLSTVNKNESIKEQQEAVDVVNMWRDRAALFNSVIQASGRRPIQAIAENIRVMTATPAQGALKASHGCALCGLKRDERLPRVDENVEDSFGEWWTDHWGHTDCKQFWESHMNLLSQR